MVVLVMTTTPLRPGTLTPARRRSVRRSGLLGLTLGAVLLAAASELTLALTPGTPFMQMQWTPSELVRGWRLERKAELEAEIVEVRRTLRETTRQMKEGGLTLLGRRRDGRLDPIGRRLIQCWIELMDLDVAVTHSPGGESNPEGDR
jgi:hypothetical protein